MFTLLVSFTLSSSLQVTFSSRFTFLAPSVLPLIPSFPLLFLFSIFSPHFLLPLLSSPFISSTLLLVSSPPPLCSLKTCLCCNYTFTSTEHVFPISSVGSGERERERVSERAVVEQVFLSWGRFLSLSFSFSPAVEDGRGCFCILTTAAAWQQACARLLFFPFLQYLVYFYMFKLWLKVFFYSTSKQHVSVEDEISLRSLHHFGSDWNINNLCTLHVPEKINPILTLVTYVFKCPVSSD